MRLLVFAIILIVAIAAFQIERNRCYWHGMDHVGDWTDCVTKL